MVPTVGEGRYSLRPAQGRPGDVTEEAPDVGQLFIDGAWVSAVDGGRREIRSPAYGTLVAEVDEAGPKDTELAIAAARRSFDDGRWSSVPAPERGALLLRVADLLQRDKARLAQAETDDTGKRVVESEIDMDDITNCFRWFGHICRDRRRAAGRHRHPGRAQQGRPRARRRLRADHAVELPAAADRVEGRAGAGGGVLVRPQAQRADAAHRDHPHGAARRGRRARRRREPRPRGGRGGRARRCRATPTWTS